MTSETAAPDHGLDDLLNRHFPGKVVRKDLTKLVKEGANVPVYVLEYLLGSYCASNDETVIAEGLQTVKRVLAENYVRPDEAEKVKSTIRERGSLKIIDKVTVALNEKRDVYEAELGNLGVGRIEVPSEIVKRYEKLLVGGIWCIATLEYFFEADQKGSPFLLRDLKPIQMPNLDLDELFEARQAFTESQWIDVLLRSTGMEPANFPERVKWHLLARMIPLVENNFNLAELGPRGTGKSHVYKEISPNSILVSGGQTTVANLFYNMARRQVGLVGLWDVVAFDEVAGISFKDKDGVQIMKDYMASGSFARGRDAINAYASMVFVGNFKEGQTVEGLVKTGHLFAPFPEAMIDSAFFDRFHAYVPGWEVPKMRPEFFTNQYGLIVDYLAEWIREMRKRNFSDAINKYFKLGRDLNQRDTIAVKHTVSGLLKLLYPNEAYDKEAVRRCLEYALEVRRRVKEQLKKIGGMEFFDVHFSYIDAETMEERFISVPEQSSGSLIPDAPLNPGVLHTVATGSSGHLGLYRLETQVTSGNGALKTSGLGSNSTAKEAIKVGFDYFKANANRVSSSIKPGDHDYHLHIVELHNSGPTTAMTLAAFVALCSGVFGKPIQQQMVVLGSMSLGGNIVPVENLAESLQVAFDAGARRLLLPMASVKDIPTIPGELFAKFQTGFYADPADAVFKALGVQ
ncbi:protease Lon-related BREX system protein BrxL [Planctellipticum variicoloris]|uniref:protease Lon-related BREX system protein BrxL n=1 Tax=Planctellipticum variicoloris TaxID=3064265 RepID=UPI003013D23C|nr:protease Lon-related BREX system protein BrxL [Planctomycetaceae bacterium SH412]